VPLKYEAVLPRFFAPDLDPSSSEVALPADEAMHLSRVLRLSAGAEVRVFDGRGHEWHAEVASATRQGASLRLVRSIAPAPELRVPIALVIGLLKGEKLDSVVRDATMLGVTAIWPVTSARAQGRRPGSTHGRVQRWQRIAVASAKQCGRAVVPEVKAPQSFEGFFTSDHRPNGLHLLLVEPQAAVSCSRLREMPQPAAAVLLIGPEGGWSPEEIQKALAAGARPVRIGGRTLRADAVPMVALAMCQALWEEE
jgi:16S rRNA (uracil1498-N3)-methyltransferase